MTRNVRLGDLLVKSEIITLNQLEEAILKQRNTSLRLGEVLVELGFATELQIAKALEMQFRIPFISLGEISIDADAAKLISENLAKEYALIPIKRDENLLTVAMSDPMNFNAIEDVKRASGLDIYTVIALKSDINDAIERYYGSESADRAVQDLMSEYASVDLDELANLAEGEIANAPVVRLINSIIMHAVKAGASDIHIEAMEKALRVRFRIDGALQEIMRPGKAALSSIVTRIKIMGGMDIAEKRIPQDGRVEADIEGRKVDMRISVMPTVYGEKIVIRLLGLNVSAPSVDNLGLTETNRVLFDKIIKSANGIILVSGPTGSGKSTTLYSVLGELNNIETNIITVEDPVEFKIGGVNQVQVNARAGLTFASGLRSILRQDPDIVMIGEIRDGETAQIAMRAAITGHLVLSTIHTNDAPSSIARLIDMGIEPFLAASSVVGVIAQRLVRKLCTRCRALYRPDHAELMHLKLREPWELFRAVGCPTCHNTGYAGRMAIHEVLPVGKEIKDLVERRASTEQIRQMGAKLGTITLRENCTQLVLEGLTTVEELLKVTYTLD